MKKIIQFVVVGFVWISTCSFSKLHTLNFIGTYGTSESDPSQIKLTINQNGTFTYHDFSDPKKKINVEGQWETKGHKVILKNNSTSYPFHDKWMFVQQGQVAKSRKGMTYYRLCKL